MSANLVLQFIKGPSVITDNCEKKKRKHVISFEPPPSKKKNGHVCFIYRTDILWRWDPNTCMYAFTTITCIISVLVLEWFTNDPMGDTKDVLFVSNVSMINAFVSENSVCEIWTVVDLCNNFTSREEPKCLWTPYTHLFFRGLINYCWYNPQPMRNDHSIAGTTILQTTLEDADNTQCYWW